MTESVTIAPSPWYRSLDRTLGGIEPAPPRRLKPTVTALLTVQGAP